ncbi:MAG TPA: hypothetical protein VF260_07220 [Bacilli bacterium]
MRLLLKMLPPILAFTFIASAYATNSTADTSWDDTKKLLQKGLTINEIDREVERLSASEKTVMEKIAANKREIAALENETKIRREAAGNVLRAYYMGERDNLWLFIFYAQNFHDLLLIYNYLNAILDGDRKILNGYADSMREIAAANERLDETLHELAQVKAQFLAQRKHLVELQNELDKELVRRNDAELLRRQIEQLNETWEKDGLPQFNEYLATFTQAMDLLPDYLNEHGASLKFAGSDITLELAESELNAFLREKDEKFKRITIAFGDGTLTLTGTLNDREMVITGHYVVRDKPENSILFLIDSLTFAGYELPETTIASLEEKYDLAIYIKKLVAFYRATEVKIEKNKLLVKLVFDF